MIPVPSFTLGRMGTWHVVAWHTSNGPAMVWSDGKAVDWSPAALPGIDDRWLPQLQAALLSRSPQSLTVTAADCEEYHVAIYPADSPTSPAYGAAVWVGRKHEPPPTKARRIAGLCWDHHKGVAVISQALFDMTSGADTDRPDSFPHTRKPQTLTRKLVAAPDVEPVVLQACMNPTAGTISGAVSILHDHGHLMNWRLNAVVDPSSRISLIGVIHDVTDTDDTPPPLDLRYRQTAGTAILTHTEPSDTPVLAEVITTRHPWMHQTCPARQLIHADDTNELAAASALIRVDASAEPVVQVRVRGLDDAWVLGDVLLTRYPTHTLAADRMRLLYFHPANRQEIDA